MSIWTSPINIPLMGIDRFSATAKKALMATGQLAVSQNKNAMAMNRTANAVHRNVTMPVIAGATAIGVQAFNFQKYMNMVDARSTKAGKTISELRAQAMDLGQTTPFTHTEVAEGMNYLAIAGKNTNEIFQMMPSTLKLASATSSSLGDTADWLTNMMQALGHETSQTDEDAAILAMTTVKTNTSLQEIAKTMEGTAPLARDYGVTFREAAGFIGMLGNAGIKGSKANTVLKNMLARMANPPKLAREELEKYNIAIEKNGELLKPKVVLADMFTKMKDMGSRTRFAFLDKVFGKRAISGGSALVRAVGDIDYFNTVMGHIDRASLKTLTENVETMEKGLVGDTHQAWSALTVMAQTIGDSGLISNISSVLKGVTYVFRALNNVNPVILNTLMTGLLALVTASAAFKVGTGMFVQMGNAYKWMTRAKAVESAGGAFNMFGGKGMSQADKMKNIFTPMQLAGKAGGVSVFSSIGSTIGLEIGTSVFAGIVEALPPVAVAAAMGVTVKQLISGAFNNAANEKARQDLANGGTGALKNYIKANPKLVEWAFWGGEAKNTEEQNKRKGVFAQMRELAGIQGSTGDDTLKRLSTSDSVYGAGKRGMIGLVLDKLAEEVAFENRGLKADVQDRSVNLVDLPGQNLGGGGGSVSMEPTVLRIEVMSAADRSGKPVQQIEVGLNQGNTIELAEVGVGNWSWLKGI